MALEAWLNYATKHRDRMAFEDQPGSSRRDARLDIEAAVNELTELTRIWSDRTIPSKHLTMQHSDENEISSKSIACGSKLSQLADRSSPAKSPATHEHIPQTSHQSESRREAPRGTLITGQQPRCQENPGFSLEIALSKILQRLDKIEANVARAESRLIQKMDKMHTEVKSEGGQFLQRLDAATKSSNCLIEEMCKLKTYWQTPASRPDTTIDDPSSMKSVQDDELRVDTLEPPFEKEWVGRLAKNWNCQNLSNRRVTTSDKTCSDLEDVLVRTLEVVRDVALGGTMFIVAPNKQLRQLVKQHVRTADGGYLNKKMKNQTIFDSKFEEVLKEFTTHTETDRWPEDCPDPEARNLPAHVRTSDITYFQISCGRIMVFTDSWHYLLPEQVHMPNWSIVSSLLLAYSDSEPFPSGEFVSQFLGMDGTVVDHVACARGQPKDGALLISSTGEFLMGAVKLVGLRRAPVKWTGVGTRHEAALQLAWALNTVFVLVRSDSGRIHAIRKLHDSPGPDVVCLDGILSRCGSNQLMRGMSKCQQSVRMDRDVFALYEIEEDRMGVGAFGMVNKATDRETGLTYAMKTVQRKKTSSDRDEIDHLMRLDHPNIIKLYHKATDFWNTYLVFELCMGGNVAKGISEDFGEKDVAHVMRQLMNGVQFMHRNHICHRDLKLENLLLKHKDMHIEKNCVKIIDFGLATPFRNTPLTSVVGTATYIAPEVYAQSYNHECDLWSCGVVAYLLLCGVLPFSGTSMEEVRLSQKQRRYAYKDPECWNSLSTDCRNFTESLLEWTPPKRLTAQGALLHPFVESFAPEASKRVLPSSHRKNLRSYCASSALKKRALCTMARLETGRIADLKRDFDDLDTNNDGVVSVHELMEGMKRADVAIEDPDVGGMLEVIQHNSPDGIKFTEFIAATSEARKRYEESVLWHAFRDFDRNGDGQIELKELEAIFEGDSWLRLQDHGFSFVHEDAVKAAMLEADLDRNGVIEFEEFVAVVRGCISPLWRRACRKIRASLVLRDVSSLSRSKATAAAESASESSQSDRSVSE